ncbi:SDR family NAD(P)-dependent oxidoreductase [Psychroflexus lacisalsi]|jgi:short-subunit dehydrogenase|uniref:SDR family oxidoreductase n=1 Tax=Psychroflexus lacisalsi TaxID=503928 RepID=A0ABN1K1N0_9FLAO|nr:SDR family NAD(P)-dependent oxidoreductase [Psychroflexus lacisalsi]MBZ9620862.1 SDR family NAD(P)-dependent oxidoreductase [Psychroflexus lacisalsi]
MSKTIVITGTSRGIGFELVKLFASEGHTVFALSRNDKPVKSLNLDNVYTFSCDLNNSSDVAEVTENIKSKVKSVDVLINNAGQFLKQEFKDTNMQDVKSVYETNVFAVFDLTHKLMPLMKESTHVVTISSMGGVQGSMKFPGLAAYSSSKAAVITLTELLAEEYKENGPSFNVLALGAVQTEMLEEAFPGLEAPNSALEMAQYIKDFSVNGQKFYNGKLLQVSSSTP